MLRKFTPILLILAVLAGLWLGFSGLMGKGNVLKLSGVIQAVEVKNGSSLGGRVKEVLVKEGDTVKKGDTLVVFNSHTVEAKLAEAEATLAQANAQLALAQKSSNTQASQAKTAVEKARGDLISVSGEANTSTQLKQAEVNLHNAQSVLKIAEIHEAQAKKLLEAGVISPKKYQLAVTQLNQAKAEQEVASSVFNTAQAVLPQQKKAAQAQLSSAQSVYVAAAQKNSVTDIAVARANVEKAQSAVFALEQQLLESTILAPIDGVVATLAVKHGELVQPGQAVVSVVNAKDLWVNVFIPESKLEQVQLGETVTVIADAWKDKAFEGKVDFINTTSEFVPNSGSSASGEESVFKVKVSVSPVSVEGNSTLYPGMTVSVQL